MTTYTKRRSCLRQRKKHHFLSGLSDTSQCCYRFRSKARNIGAHTIDSIQGLKRHVKRCQCEQETPPNTLQMYQTITLLASNTVDKVRTPTTHKQANATQTLLALNPIWTRCGLVPQSFFWEENPYSTKRLLWTSQGPNSACGEQALLVRKIRLSFMDVHSHERHLLQNTRLRLTWRQLCSLITHFSCTWPPQKTKSLRHWRS